MGEATREKARVTLRLQRPKAVDAPKGWEGALSVWRLKPRSFLERVFISKFDSLPAHVRVKVPREMVDSSSSEWVLVIWLRTVKEEDDSRLCFTNSHPVRYESISDVETNDFIVPASSKNALKNALWAKTDFRALLNASRRDGRVVINPHFWLKQCRMVSANTGVAVTWVLRLSIGRLLSGKEADSPNSSDGIPSDRDELAPDYNVVTDAALRPKSKTIAAVALFHAATHEPLTDADIVRHLNGEPLSDIEEDRGWMVQANAELVDEYVDVEEEEKAFFKLWNAHVIPIMPVRRDPPALCRTFMEATRKELVELDLRLSLLRHLLHLLEFRLITRHTLMTCMAYYDTGAWPE